MRSLQTSVFAAQRDHGNGKKIRSCGFLPKWKSGDTTHGQKWATETDVESSSRSSPDRFVISVKDWASVQLPRDPATTGGAVLRTRRTRRTAVMSATVVLPAATVLRLRWACPSASQRNLAIKQSRRPVRRVAMIERTKNECSEKSA